jgi:hypothetical protein
MMLFHRFAQLVFRQQIGKNAGTVLLTGLGSFRRPPPAALSDRLSTGWPPVWR